MNWHQGINVERTVFLEDVIPKPRAFTRGAGNLARSISNWAATTSPAKLTIL